MTACSFCARGADMQARTFYERDNWFAFLAAPANLAGHTILAVSSADVECPQNLSANVLRGLDRALADVTRLLRIHYQPKRVLFASLRAIDPHVHIHVFPVAEADENAWRQEKGTGYEKGRLFEFLGDRERAMWGQQSEPDALKADVQALNALARQHQAPST